MLPILKKTKYVMILGITYDVDVLRLIQSFRDKGLYVGSVVITQYSGQASADLFKAKLEKMGIAVYRHYVIEGYPNNISRIVSAEGFGKNDYIKTTKPLVIITAPGVEAAKWLLVFHSFITKIREELRQAMLNLRPFLSESALKASGKPCL